MRLVILIGLSVAFTAYTLAVMAGHGVTGFITLAGREPWALQLLVDLLVMLGVFSVWVWRDAKERKLPPALCVLIVMTMGSMGALAYLVHRELSLRRRAAA